MSKYYFCHTFKEVTNETVKTQPVAAVKTVGTKKQPTNTYKGSNTKYVSGLVPAQDFALDKWGALC